MLTDKLRNISNEQILKTCTRCGQNLDALGRDHACATSKEPSPDGRAPSAKLSFRERQIVHLIQQAKSNKEIAYELSLTVGTVKEYIYHIFRKLGVTNRTELALWGREFQPQIELAS